MHALVRFFRMNMKYTHVNEVQEHYVTTLRELTKHLREATALKTDAFNETVFEERAFPRARSIVCALENVSFWHVVEIQCKRVDALREKFARQSFIDVKCADLTEVFFADRMFDIIIDTSTINYINPRRFKEQLVKYNAWLKSGGILYICAWVRSASSDDWTSSDTADNRHVLNMFDFSSALARAGFMVHEVIPLLSGDNTNTLTEFVCTRALNDD